MRQPIAKIIVDAPLSGTLDYLQNECVDLEVGDRCLVPFGKRTVVGIVTGFSDFSDFPANKLKSVLKKPDEIAPFKEDWLRLTAFAGKYYLSTWGRAAVGSLPKFFRSIPNSNHLKALEKFRNQKETKKTQQPHPPALTQEQEAVVEDFKTREGFQPALLFGVTGSGKTEVYLRLIEEKLRMDPDAQVLLLVPEINLTPQLVKRVADRFPKENVSVWHSGMAEGKKAGAWLSVHEGRSRILVGTRLSVFASFRKLAFIIIDEEHDASYKSREGLRYSARDLAVKRAQILGIPILLGSATPSLETFYKALSGNYLLYRMIHRAHETAVLPSLELVDLRLDPPTEGLSASTVQNIEKNLEKGHQTLVFLNRRGYAPVVTCNSCGWVSMCPHCSAYAVFHKTTNRLTCHHCGWSTPIYKNCPDCGSVELIPIGRGTQRIEEEFKRHWEGANILRMDQDTTSRRGSVERALEKVHSGEIDILLGTQMVAKGHDFQNITLVVILNTDSQLMSGDLRARERLFSVLVQVAGRAGRGKLKGKVLVQTKFPEDPFFDYLRTQNYEAFAREELQNRRDTKMPPYTALALMVAEGPEIGEVLKFLHAVKQKIEPFGTGAVRIFDPVPQTVTRIQDIDRGQMLIEADNRAQMQVFLQKADRFLKEANLRVPWYIDVDPIYF